MNAPLYSLDILRLAASTESLKPLPHAQASVEKRSPACGSRVRIDLSLDDAGRIAEVGGDIHACALGQASAALMASHAIGSDKQALDAARDDLRRYLAGQASSPGDWPGLEIFEPARKHTGRHAAILLAFDAAAEAVATARK